MPRRDDRPHTFATPLARKSTIFFSIFPGQNGLSVVAVCTASCAFCYDACVSKFSIRTEKKDLFRVFPAFRRPHRERLPHFSCGLRVGGRTRSEDHRGTNRPVIGRHRVVKRCSSSGGYCSDKFHTVREYFFYSSKKAYVIFSRFRIYFLFLKRCRTVSFVYVIK